MIGLSVISISAQFVIIPAIGLWIDRQCGTGVLFAAIGLALGMFTGIRQLMRLNHR
jgi:F0F1-type ATP synthase assembly protein I